MTEINMGHNVLIMADEFEKSDKGYTSLSPTLQVGLSVKSLDLKGNCDIIKYNQPEFTIRKCSLFSEINCCSITNDDHYIACGLKSGDIVFIDIEDNMHEFVRVGHYEETKCIASSNNCAFVVSRSYDKNLIIWSLNNQTSKVVSDSPLRFILSQPALKWAWYLLLAGVLIFIIFNLRRTQRPIPILPKNLNTSVEFVKTIGNLYYQEGDIRNLIDKKIILNL